MGHSFDIVDEDGSSADTWPYMTFNWSVYSDIFHAQDLQGHRGEVVAKILQKALDALAKEGVVPLADGEDPESLKVDGWGNEKGGKPVSPFSWKDQPHLEHDRKRKWASILSVHKSIALRYPESRWYSDCVDALADPFEGEEAEPDLRSDSDSGGGSETE